MPKPHGPKRKLVVTFHNKETGKRHGPIIALQGDAKFVAHMHKKTTEDIQRIQPKFKNITPRLSESNIGTTVGFHGINQRDWDRLFGKKKK